MKYILSIVTLIFALSTNAFAHDPSMHKADAEKPDCAAMHDTKLDASDPVMLAMQKKCESKMQMEHHEEAQAESRPHAKADPKPMQCTMEHEKMGHCEMMADDAEVDAEVDAKSEEHNEAHDAGTSENH